MATRRERKRGTRASPPERQWLKLLGTLNEFQARLCLGQRALELGRGGISRLAALTGMSRPTIMRGAAEIAGGRAVAPPAPGRSRRPGAGRKRVEDVEPRVRRELTRILDETTAGDPMSLLKWTNRSTRNIAAELTRRGCPVTAPTVGRCLRELGYSLQANVKSREGPQHPDRDAQFRYINQQVKRFLRAGEPVLSVDTKKKELVGPFRNPGRTWRPRGQPETVLLHDFPHLGDGKAIPYGAYDLGRNEGFVNVGITHDTAEFAVESIRRWWRLLGKRAYPHATRLLLCADAGGSNGTRLRAWKLHLQRLADALAIPVSVCHYPPGTSKWNKIEHRMFAFISLNWKGRPLVSYQTIINLISGTRTRTGLKIKAALDTTDYETGAQVSPDEFERLRLRPGAIQPAWNYTLLPRG